MKRRVFLKTVGGAAGATVILGFPFFRKSAAAETSASDLPLPKRELGKTGLKISTAGFSGFALNKYSQDECNRGVRSALDKGVNYFDVAPAYGESENRMGIALQGVERSKYYLACKTKMRDAKGAMEELERSLKRLKTDYFDVYQLHHLRRPEEVQQALAPGGAMEAILKAKEQGKVRFIGFSAHTQKAALEALKSFKFDTIMFPINFVEYYKFDFGKSVLEEAEKQGIGVLAMKAMSWGGWKREEEQTRKWWYRSAETVEEVNLAVRFALSFAPVASAFAPAYLDLIDKCIEAAKIYRPLTEAERQRLKEIAQTRDSLFKREEDAVAMFRGGHYPVFADSPYESENWTKYHA